MKIKRFFAPDIRQAMKMVKEELGSEAVIMTNRSVDGGVEIVAARDFDEQVIHDKLKKNIVEDSNLSQKQAIKKAGQSDKKPVHIISSARKKGADGSVKQNLPRRNTDQYLGYAEKIHLSSGQQQSQKIAEKMAVPKKLNNHSHQTDNKNIGVQKAQKSESFLVEQLLQDARQEMRSELKGMKAALDARIAEAVWNHDQERQPARLDLLRRMADMGFSKTLSEKIANRLGSHTDPEIAFNKAQEMLAKIIPKAEHNLLEQGGIVALVGPTGVGKTTTIAKIASQFILKHGSRQVALITTDNYRIGAHEQLNTYGRILEIPVRAAKNAEQLHSFISGFSDKRLILIDTAGMSQRDMRLAEQIKTFRQDNISINTFLVMSAGTQYKEMNEILDAFKIFEPQAGILTKLDEAATQGASLSAIIEKQLPLSFLTDGQKVPEDIHQPDAISLIKQCVAGLDQENDYTNNLSYEDWVAEGYA